MRKSTTFTVWITGLGFLIGGLLIAGAGVGVLLANGGTWSQGAFHGEFQPTMNGLFWGSVAMMATGGVAFLVGGILQFVAWIGAMINTARSPDKTWFVLLLVLGLIGLPFVIMIAYLIAGPDVQSVSPPSVPMPPPLAPPQPPLSRAA